jgi:hypothetical protein
VTGLLNTSRQMEQEETSSDPEVAEAIPRKHVLSGFKTLHYYYIYIV